MYRVIKHFIDLHDNDYRYDIGDTYPREGIEVSEARAAELAGSGNKQGEPLIELVEETSEKDEEVLVEETSEKDEEVLGEDEEKTTSKKKTQSKKTVEEQEK